LEIRLLTDDSDSSKISTIYFTIGNCFKELRNYYQAIDNYSKGFKINSMGRFPFRIAQCYEALLDFNAAFDYYLQSAEIRKNDEEVGLDHSATQESTANAIRLAQQLSREDELPKWIFESE
jgi:tetratricopeptide (TPR) repeat protein